MEACQLNSEIRVLVTGASGYLAAHCVQQLLSLGYTVRGTVRNLANKTKVQPLLDLEKHTNSPSGKLELVEADLNKADSWISAVDGCHYVLHVASPFPIVADESVIKTAIEGTLNVLRACAASTTVKKVILTSSCAAINEGHEDENRVFTENDWSVVDNKKVLPYARSKTEAERAAWEFVSNLKEGNKFVLTCLNPTFIVGPILIDTQGTSITVIRRFMNNEMPATPPLNLALVDVRDVANAHILAMRNAESDGQRILITSQPSFWFLDISKILAREFRSQGYWLPRFQVPYAVVWLYSFFDSETKQVLDRLNRRIRFDNNKAKTLLNMEYTNPEKSLVDMVYSMIDRGILPRKCGNKNLNTSDTIKEK
ncbi:3-beta hydroxysteroid dehydrogenase/isomerase family domain-containing protein [Ditylenchus destructor]|nr:3-beta hydroxysteroid dehydrogenase/isomerase family domain-containing protein [Ditylenchus destructor]